MQAAASLPRIGGPCGPWLGALVLAHFAAVCGIKLVEGIGADVCWMSHVSLAFAGAGLALRSAPLLSAALIGVLIPHAVWLFDCFGWALFGAFPLGVTSYLDGADTLKWVATAHHFYLMPLLLYVVVRWRAFVPGVFRWVALLFFGLSLYSRFALPETRNVNSAFALIPSVDLALVRWLNALPALPFLLFLNLWMSVVMLWPAVKFLQRLGGYGVRHDPPRFAKRRFR